MRAIYWLVLVVLASSGCGEKLEDPGCDIFTGSAMVTGVARDSQGDPLMGASVEFTVSSAADCQPNFLAPDGHGLTNSEGQYEVLLQSGNAVGTYCVFGRVAGSDSVSNTTVRFTSDCRRSEPLYSVELNLVATHRPVRSRRSDPGADVR